MLGANLTASHYIERLQQELAELDLAALQSLADAIYSAWEQGRFVFVIGNGGSGTTATHMCEDFAKSLLPPSELLEEDRRRLRIMSLTDNTGWILAVGNDVGYDQIFQQQLMNFASPGDVLVAISGSGNSPNILRAAEYATRTGLFVFGLTGFDGGQLRTLADECLHVEFNDMGMVESLHLCALHWVLDDVFGRVNKCGRYSQDVAST